VTPPGQEIRLSDGEKLITLMLCELYKHLKIKSALDPTFVEDAIHQGHLWALGWRYSGIFHGNEASKPTLQEVVDILDMWSALERGYTKLSRKDKDRVKAEAEPFGKHVVFSGFDGNDEGEHLGVASFLINKLERFSQFQGRDLNSHCPLLNAYRRMTNVFEPMRANLIGQELTASQIIDILRAEAHPKAQKR